MPDQHVIEAIYESACSRRVVKADQRCRDFAVPRSAPRTAKSGRVSRSTCGPPCPLWRREFDPGGRMIASVGQVSDPCIDARVAQAWQDDVAQ